MKLKLCFLLFFAIISWVHGFMKLQKKKYRPLKWSKRPTKLPHYLAAYGGGYSNFGNPSGYSISGFPIGGYRQSVYRTYNDDDDDDDNGYYGFRRRSVRRVGYGLPRFNQRKNFGYMNKKPYFRQSTFPSYKYGQQYFGQHRVGYGSKYGYGQKFGKYRRPVFGHTRRCICSAWCPRGTYPVGRCRRKYQLGSLCCPVWKFSYR